MTTFAHGIVWLRRELRLDDNAVVDAAATHCRRVSCVFVLDPVLLRGPRVGAPIVQFFFASLQVLRDRLRGLGSELVLLEGDAGSALARFASEREAQAVFHARDTDPQMRRRDALVSEHLTALGIAVRPVDDLLFAAPGELVLGDGRPYTAFAPFRRRWEALRAADPRPPVPSAAAVRGKLTPARALGRPRPVPRPEAYGHRSSERFPAGGEAEARRLLGRFVAELLPGYAAQRNDPAAEATSRLSPHLRAGTIGIRTCVAAAAGAGGAPGAAIGGSWLGELAWREFYHHLLAGIPRVAEGPFLERACRIAYREDEGDWQAWCTGRTGFPLVDAAMGQLNQTGWMHNRLRMVVASFLTKDLLLDYRHGERYFEQHLADADLAANDGGWQWSASTGADAAPYFRVFNPVLQGQRFDPGGRFVRRWLPALARVPDRFVHAPWTMPPLLAAEVGCVIGRDYPGPVVDHGVARERALAAYGRARGRPSPGP